MAWSKDVTIWCDGEDCHEWFQSNSPTVKGAESDVRDRGWTKASANEHYCPDCS
jgi:hypothetical protein